MRERYSRVDGDERGWREKLINKKRKPTKSVAIREGGFN